MHPLATVERRNGFLRLRQIPPDVSPSTPAPSLTPSNDTVTTTRTPIVAITAVSLAAIIFLVFFTYILKNYQSRNNSSNSSPKTPDQPLWRRWFMSSKPCQPNQQFEPITSFDGRDMTTHASLPTGNRNSTTHRAESIRSVITLPAYIPYARQNERVLGREGERAGIDVVVEFPDTAEEEEQRREDEMEALYQVRVARRRENERREERRRLRREASEIADPSLREELMRRASEPQSGLTIEELRAQHERLKIQRQRAVSVVSYAELGVARHDGSRLSLKNQESEHVGLLGSAASISTSGHSPDLGSASIGSLENSNSELLILPSSYEMPSAPYTTHVWGISGEISRTSRQFSQQSDMIVPTSTTARLSHRPSCVPPEYIQTPPLSPAYSTELPPNYPGPASQHTRLESQASATSEHPGGSPGDSTQSISQSKNMINTNPMSHNRTSITGNLPTASTLKIDHLPSIRVDPASPLVGRDPQELVRMGEPG